MPMYDAVDTDWEILIVKLIISNNFNEIVMTDAIVRYSDIG